MIKDQFVNKTINDYTFVKKLGGGQFGAVYEAINLQNSNSVAIKTIQKKQILFNPKLSELLQTQIKVLRTCNNQNVLKYINNFQTEQYRFIVTELLDGQDLEKYLKKKKRLSEDQSVTYLKQIMNGFKGLHEVQAMHRDLKLANIVLHRGVCKIIDLGFAKIMKNIDVTQTRLGSSFNMAPEILKNLSYGIEADIWSIGVILYQMISGDYPFIGLNDKDQLKEIKRSKPNFKRLNISEQLEDFISKCLTVDPDDRITWKEMYDHPLLQKNQSKVLSITSRNSSAIIEHNRSFYHENEIQPNKKYVYPQLNQSRLKSKFSYKPANSSTSLSQNNLQELILQSEMKKQMQTKIIEHERLYLFQRNKYFIFFKFVIPQISIISLSVNHALIMFLCSKNSYLKMKNLDDALQLRQNIFNLDIKHWQNFKSSMNYQKLLQHFMKDVSIAQHQTQSYRKSIQENCCSKDIRKELVTNQINSKNWNAILNEQMKSYWYQLVQKLKEEENKQKKKSLILVLKALEYMLNNPEDDAIQFAQNMQIINFEKQEKQYIKNFDLQIKSFQKNP